MRSWMITAALLTMATSAQADNNWSVEISVGQADTEQRQFHDDILTSEERDSSWGLGVYYQASDAVEVGLGYIDQGEGQAVLQGDTLNPEQYHRTVADVVPVLAEGITAGARLTLWQGRQLAVKGETGLVFWDADILSQAQSGTLVTELDGEDIYWGLAADYVLNEDWSVGVRARQYRLLENVNEWALTVNYHF